jgi:hypothetical protein
VRAAPTAAVTAVFDDELMPTDVLPGRLVNEFVAVAKTTTNFPSAPDGITRVDDGAPSIATHEIGSFSIGLVMAAEHWNHENSTSGVDEPESVAEAVRVLPTRWVPVTVGPVVKDGADLIASVDEL